MRKAGLYQPAFGMKKNNDIAYENIYLSGNAAVIDTSLQNQSDLFRIKLFLLHILPFRYFVFFQFHDVSPWY